MKVSNAGEAFASSETFILEKSVADLQNESFRVQRSLYELGNIHFGEIYNKSRQNEVSEAGEAPASSETSILEKSLADLSKMNV